MNRIKAGAPGTLIYYDRSRLIESNLDMKKP
jgi:hypothetical protein